MDVGNLLAGAAAHLEGAAENAPPKTQTHSRNPSNHQSLTTQAFNFPARQFEQAPMLSPARPSAARPNEPRPSPSKQQKQVTFELVLPEGQNRENRARLPMRVMISPHDTTDSIVTTVKNFYGLYDGPGLVFQDTQENILIASYDNFHQDMNVRVTVTAPDPAMSAAGSHSRSTTLSPRKGRLGAPFEMRPPTRSSRPASRAAIGRSPSPQSTRSHRSASAIAASRARSRPHKTKDHGSFTEGHTDAYSDSEDGEGSVSSSRREAHVSAEISVNNIVEGGRRKRAKFDSSVSIFFLSSCPCFVRRCGKLTLLDRSCHCSCHLKYLLQTLFPPSLHKDVSTGTLRPLPMRGPTNALSPMPSHSLHLRATLVTMRPLATSTPPTLPSMARDHHLAATVPSATVSYTHLTLPTKRIV